MRNNLFFPLLITATNLAFIVEFGEAFCGKGVNGDLYLPPTSIPIFLTLKKKSGLHENLSLPNDITLLLTREFSYCHSALRWLLWAQQDIAGEEQKGSQEMRDVRRMEREETKLSKCPTPLGTSTAWTIMRGSSAFVLVLHGGAGPAFPRAGAPRRCSH